MEVVILGNGGAATSAIKTFASREFDGNITIVSKDKTLPYSPVALPYYIEGKISRRQMYLLPRKFYQEHGIKTLWGKGVASVIAGDKEVLLEDGSRLGYDKLLVATGASSRLPNIKGIRAKGVFTLGSLADADAIKKNIKKDVVIVGAGPIGIGLAIVLRRMGMEVSLVELLPQVLGRLLDTYGSQTIVDLLKGQGVKVYLNSQVSEIYSDPVAGVKVDGKKDIPCDTVVVAIGVKPNTEFLNKAEIALGESRGLIVDSRMRSSQEDIYAAGDCVETEDLMTGRKGINAIWPNAIEQGKVAALNIMGLEAQFSGSIVMNAVSVFDVPVACVGCMEGEKVSQFYLGTCQTFTLQEGKVVGAQLVANIDDCGKMASMIRRRLLGEKDLPWGYIKYLSQAQAMLRETARV